MYNILLIQNLKSLKTQGKTISSLDTSSYPNQNFKVLAALWFMEQTSNLCFDNTSSEVVMHSTELQKPEREKEASFMASPTAHLNLEGDLPCSYV